MSRSHSLPNILRPRIPDTECPGAPRKKVKRALFSGDVRRDGVKRRLVFDGEGAGVATEAEAVGRQVVDGLVALSVRERARGCVEPRVCVCTDSEKALMCRETLSGSSVSTGRCPACHRGLAGQDTVGDGVGYTTYSDDEFIVTPYPGLRCKISVFSELSMPYLYESDDAGNYLVVYVPKSASFCDEYCEQIFGSGRPHLLGKGAFGEIWLSSDEKTALKAAGAKTYETVLTTWISGVVRAKAETSGGFAGSVYRGILAATGCCLKHNVTVSAALQSDMYKYMGWSVNGLDSYRRAFSELGDGLRFLSLRCGISHFDITPMNILVVPDATRRENIERAVLCDFSLSEPHPQYNGRCVVVFEETKTARMLSDSRYRLCDIYHPAFRPLVLQKLICADPCAVFPDGCASRYCVAELCALGNVAAFCLVRALDRRGVRNVQCSSENSLFRATARVCEALDAGNMDEYANACSILLTRQLAYAAALFDEEARGAADELAAFFRGVCDPASGDFRVIYAKSRYEVTGAYLEEGLRCATLSESGRYLLDNIKRTCLATRSEDLDADPSEIFR